MTQRTAARVLVADRRRLYGAAIRAGIEEHRDLDVVAVTETAETTLEGVGALAPDIVVIDALLPPTGGIEICARVKAHATTPAVMIVDDAPRSQILLEAFEANADGYTTRDVSLLGFITALHAIGRGEVSVPRAMQAALIRGLRASQREHERLALCYWRLTRREREVAELLADGLGGSAIADVLSISPQTVRTHIQNVLGKLEVHSRLEAAALVRRHRSRTERDVA